MPCVGMAPINRLNLMESNGFNVSEMVQQPDVATAKSEIPFIFRIESNSATTCWPSFRLDVMTQTDKEKWLKTLKIIQNYTVQNSYPISKSKKYQTVLRLEKHQVIIDD